MTTLYDQDFNAWLQEQAALLKARRLKQLDIEHLVEEIEDLGKREKRALRSRLAVLIGHLLKCDFQPEYPQKSWLATIRTQRREVNHLLADSPSLRPLLPEFIDEAYPGAIDLILAETPLDETELPERCPYGVDDILGTG